MSQKDGGPAFSAPGQRGMSLRDYFAAQFLMTYQARGGGDSADVVAANCYRVADAMLAERDK